jgi:phage terminase large subunit
VVKIELILKGYPNPKQKEFFLAQARHIAYGGARGGGKSWAMRRKFVLLALNYAGLKLLLLRRTLPELRENHIMPLLAELVRVAKYSDNEKAFIFPNGSRIKLGYCESERDVYQYQGQEYDVIGLEEATHFTETQRDFLTTCNRSVRTDFKPRMYYTANPGNVGHQWFKRLFIDRDYRGSEKADDYIFIPARVYDNTVLMDTNPEYVQTLENLPEDLRRAHLDGDWDVFAGQYFREFSRDIHVIEPFPLPDSWRLYIAIDYGLDMLAAYWIAVDWHQKAYVYKELYQSDLIISEAAKRIKEMTGKDKIYQILAPPDLWNRRQETGKSAADLFRENGVSLVKANNNRIQGWYNLKEWLKPYDDEQGIKTASLVIFKNCVNLIRTLPLLQRDEKDPNDVATEPHELTHAPDAIRYFIAGRPKPNWAKKPDPHYNFDFERKQAEKNRGVTVTEDFFKGGWS